MPSKSKQFPHSHPSCNGKWHKIGSYLRKSDSQSVQRWRCSACRKSSSSAFLHPCYRQNKRHLNFLILKLLCSTVSQRRVASLLKISRLTVARKFHFLHAQHKLKNQLFLKKYLKKTSLLEEVFIDEMEDRIHTKCKPVAIAIAVTKDRKILAHQSSPIRPKNRDLLEISIQKYPYWNPMSKEGFSELVKQLVPLTHPKVKIYSDEKYFYPKIIKEHLPYSEHKRYKSRKAVIAGQGELKQGGKDPLFSLNHTCAMLRANINRLIRRTWCTSKKIENLQKHIELYTYYHNTVLTQ